MIRFFNQFRIASNAAYADPLLQQNVDSHCLECNYFWTVYFKLIVPMIYLLHKVK